MLSGCLILAAAALARPADPAPTRPQQVELQGRVVCLLEEMHHRFEADLPTDHEHLLGFKTTQGEYYTLLQSRMSKALFMDARLREKTLVLKGRVFPASRVLEITGNLHSMKNGQLHELYYFCDICIIKTIAPDPCLCCQAPVELLEVPSASNQ